MLSGILIGLVAGILIGWLLIYLLAPSMMFREDKISSDFNGTVDRLEKIVEARDWKIPHVHDLKETLKKFGKDVRDVKVFEVCHPDHSYEILSRNDERVVSNLMPCRIAVYEKQDGSVWISRMNSGMVAKPMSRVIRKTMSAAAKDIEVIIAELMEE